MQQDQPLTTRLRDVSPSELRLLEKNARRMTERQFKALCENIRRDGCLTSAPLVYEADGSLRVLSGNHRVKAAMAIGLQTISVIEITSPISDARQVAIQLAQNAITGDDDQNILQELYDSLDLMEKRYSGLTDGDFNLLADPELLKLKIGLPDYQEVVIAFLPEERAAFAEKLQQLSEKAKSLVLYAKFADYPRYFEGIVQTKSAMKVGNDAIALAIMAELALERLAQINGEDQTQEAE